MPTTNARKQIIPAGGDASITRATIFSSFGNSLRDIVAVANTTERGQLVTDLTAAGQAPSATKPLYVHRADARGLHRIEYTVDGSVWLPASGVLDFATLGAANSFGTANSALLTTSDICRIAGVEYQWQGVWRLKAWSGTARLTVGGVALTASTETVVATLTLPAEAPAGSYLVSYVATTGAGSTTAHLQRVIFAGVELTNYINDYMANVPVGDVSKSETLLKTGHVGGAATITLEVRVNASGGACRYARLTAQYVGP